MFWAWEVQQETGLCSCFGNFALPDCAEPGGTECPRGLGGICSGHGFCTLHGFCSRSDALQKTPGCDRGYRGKNCAISVVNNTGCRGEKHPCSGHGECGPDGVCYVDYFAGKVGCDMGWGGANCGKPAVKDLVSSDCPSKTYKECSGHGQCNAGRCACNLGWETPDCHVPSSSPKCPKYKNKTCGGHGVCLENSKCGCECGFSGQSCSIGPGNGLSCPSGVDEETLLPGLCSNHGLCDAENKCVCSNDWKGPSCAEAVTEWSCPTCNEKPCSGHGTCDLPNKLCKCDVG